MTDQELWAAAWAELTKTTDAYPTWARKGFPSSSHWAIAKKYGDQIGAPIPPPVVTPPTTSVPSPPTLTTPVTFKPVSGVVNFFDAGGKDCIVQMPGTVEQQQAPNDNACVTVKNARNVVVTPGHIHAQYRQAAGVGNGYGYGLYLVGCTGTAYVDSLVADGPGLAQAIVASGCPKLVVVNSTLKPMHPVWHVAAGKPAEVHTDGIQSYGGPGILGLHSTTIETCGTPIQVQPYKGPLAPMGTWVMHDVTVAQVTNPDSDEMPFCLTKDPSGGAKWPTDFRNCKIHALGTAFGVSWVPDPAAWAPGGAWSNTGDPWVAV